MGWCWFHLTCTVRAAGFITTHISWTLILLLNCLYFQAWKSVDVFWYWLHLVLCLAIPAMRSSSALYIWYTLLRWRCCVDSQKTFKQVYVEQFCRHSKQRTFCHHCKNCLCCGGDAIDASHDDDDKHDMEMEVCVCARNVQRIGGAHSNNRSVHRSLATTTYARRPFEMLYDICLASSTPHSICTASASLLPCCSVTRDKNSPALCPTMAGVCARAHVHCNCCADFNDGASSAWPRWISDYNTQLRYASIVTIVLDIALIWLSILQAYCRQCRFCYDTGLCRCLQWTMCIVLVEIIVVHLTAVRNMGMGYNLSTRSTYSHINRATLRTAGRITHVFSPGES